MTEENNSEALSDSEFEHVLTTSLLTKNSNNEPLMTLSKPISVSAPPVSFIKELKSIKVFESETALLSCQISDSYGDVEWFFNGVSLDFEKEGKFIRPLADQKARKLVISNSSMRHAGVYECRADNNITSCKLDVQKQPITVIEGLASIDVITNQSAELKCVISREIKNLEWYHGTLNIESANVEFRKRISVNTIINKDKTMTCTFKMVKCFPRDSGIISLRGEEVIISQGAIDICDPPIHFIRNLSNQIVKIREKIVLSCDVSDPLAAVTWHKDNVPLVAGSLSDRHKYENNKNERVLVIDSALRSDDGCYTCMTTDGRTTSCQVFVKIPDVKIIQELKDIECFAGDAVENKVIINTAEVGNTAKWLFDGEPISQHIASGKIEVNYEMTEYEIRISGDLIQDTDSMHIIVFKATEFLSSTCQINVKTKPIKWEVSLPDIEVREGKDLELPCTLSVPNEDVEWFFNDAPIAELMGYDNSYSLCNAKIVADGKVHKLILPEVCLQTAGVYTCITERRNKKTECKVKVKPLRVDILADLPTSLDINEGEELKLCINYKPIDVNIEWLFNNKPITEGFSCKNEIKSMSSFDVVESSLINEFANSLNHSGIYSAVIGRQFEKPYNCDVKVKREEGEFGLTEYYL